MTASRRALLHWAGAGAVLGAAGACARIPTDSPIDSRALTGGGRPGAPYVRALPPAEDATPEQVLTGFVQAGVGSEEDYAVAREYLTPEARRSWDPDAGVTVYSGADELRVESVDDDTVSLSLQAVILVDGRGVRTVLAAPTAHEITVRLESVDGQWRIADPPPGIHLSSAAFDALFTPARLYFVDPRHRHLVPDPRWYPSHRAVTAVLEGLRDGAVEPLNGAVRNIVPSGADMEGATVTTGPDGTAQVAIPTAVGSLSNRPRAVALTQIETSLRSLRALSDVRLTWRGTDLTTQVERLLKRPLPGHRPIGAGATGVVSLADTGPDDELAQLVPDLAATAVRAPSISQDGVLACALTPERSAVLVAATDGSFAAREAATGADFVDPQPDDAGYVWTSVRSGAGVLLALSGQGAELDVTVEAPWLRGRDVVSLNLSTDATRMAVVSSDEAGTRLDLCAVRRNGEGTPLSVSEPVVVRTGMDDLLQARWYDEVALVLLGTDPADAEPRAQVMDLTTGQDPLPPPREGTVRIAGSVVAESVWAATQDGALMRSAGDRWAAVDLPATDPSFY